MKNELTVGEMAERSGVAVSTLHFYERKGLIRSRRTAGNQRRYPRGLLRLIAVIRIAQRAGIPLSEIKESLLLLPDNRAPTAREWGQVSAGWRDQLNERITALTQLRDQMQDCIGCGCLSVASCPLRNPSDIMRKAGPGPVLLR